MSVAAPSGTSLDGLVEELVHAFNEADATAFAGCFTAEAVFVNLYGRHMVGRSGIEAGHARAFASRLTGAVLVRAGARVTAVTEDVSHVHQRWTMHYRTAATGGRVAARSGTLVLLAARTTDGWAFAGGTNVADDEPAS